MKDWRSGEAARRLGRRMFYMLGALTDGEYMISAEASTNNPGAEIRYFGLIL